MITSLIVANTEKDTANVKPVGSETFGFMNDEDVRANLIEAFIAGTDSIIYYINKHPNVKQKMISEIESVFSYKSRNDPLKLKYCDAIIKETSLWPNPEVFDPDRFYNVDQDDKRLVTIFGGSPRICPGRKLSMSELLLLMALVYKHYNVELVNINEPLKIAGVTDHILELKLVAMSQKNIMEEGLGVISSESMSNSSIDFETTSNTSTELITDETSRAAELFDLAEAYLNNYAKAVGFTLRQKRVVTDKEGEVRRRNLSAHVLRKQLAIRLQFVIQKSFESSLALKVTILNYGHMKSSESSLAFKS
ncbi:cytochrome P450 [Gigaspora rosea]|uniref:Cytochrome P450 n=1 Tax=Gigaspora rosea TaxID=44941 RepID=A0A397VUL8_9GLOM|nr:cytochrome P450 [Gigaspora rosea]